MMVIHILYSLCFSLLLVYFSIIYNVFWAALFILSLSVLFLVNYFRRNTAESISVPKKDATNVRPVLFHMKEALKMRPVLFHKKDAFKERPVLFHMKEALKMRPVLFHMKEALKMRPVLFMMFLALCILIVYLSIMDVSWALILISSLSVMFLVNDFSRNSTESIYVALIEAYYMRPVLFRLFLTFSLALLELVVYVCIICNLFWTILLALMYLPLVYFAISYEMYSFTLLVIVALLLVVYLIVQDFWTVLLAFVIFLLVSFLVKSFRGEPTENRLLASYYSEAFKQGHYVCSRKKAGFNETVSIRLSSWEPMYGTSSISLRYILYETYLIHKDLFLNQRVNLIVCHEKSTVAYVHTLFTTVTKEAYSFASFEKWAELVLNDYAQFEENYNDQPIFAYILQIFPPMKQGKTQDSKTMEKTSLINMNQIRHYSSKASKNEKFFTQINTLTLEDPSVFERKIACADTETILLNNIHVVVMIGVFDGKTFKAFTVPAHITDPETVNKISKQIMCDFINYLKVLATNNIKFVYFHNLDFDGIFLLNYLIQKDVDSSMTFENFLLKGKIYRIKLKFMDKNNPNEIEIHDSCKLLPKSLKELGNTVGDQIGKLDFNIANVNLSNYSVLYEQMYEYFQNDCVLLYNIVNKCRDLFKESLNMDMVGSLSISSFAFKIFRTLYYSPEPNAIKLLRDNPLKFIRQAYYGGHVDVYKPYGKNLHHYDVNSLYPFCMLQLMPTGTPYWSKNLMQKDLNSMFGFIRCLVICPNSVYAPILPYRDPKTGTLTFPTGAFYGVYFTEELKYAVKIGYKIFPLEGYLYDSSQVSYPFNSFVDSLYSNRVLAKQQGNTALAFLFKLILNSLYGRLGLRPDIQMSQFINKQEYEKFSEDKIILQNSPLVDNDQFNFVTYINADNHSNQSVACAAAITAYARIHVAPFLQNTEIYYTDTDSLFLSKPLDMLHVSNDLLGKLKYEGFIKEAYFLRPKYYSLLMANNTIVTKPNFAKLPLNHNMFHEIYHGTWEKNQKVIVKNPFMTNLLKLNKYSKQINYELTINQTKKRLILNDSLNLWINTRPISVIEIYSWLYNELAKPTFEGIKTFGNQLSINQQLIKIKLIINKLKRK